MRHMSIMKKIGMCKMVSLNELHLQGNQLKLLPPKLGEVMDPEDSLLRLGENPWIQQLKVPIEEKDVLKYIKSPEYITIYETLNT